jgi:hypothetical protein
MLRVCQQCSLLLLLFSRILSKCGIDTTLCGDCVRSCREKLGNASSVESCLGKTKSGTQASATSSYYNSIILMVDNWIPGPEARADFSFSRPKRRTCDDLGDWSCGGEVAGLRT